ncbi:MAG: hypothetical protein V9F01_01435 [Chitinophagaceae bacterium]
MAFDLIKKEQKIPNGFYKESASNSFLYAYSKLNPDKEFKLFLAKEMAGEQGATNEYKNDLENKAGFPPPSKEKKYLLVNYRLSGQANKGVHPCLDTGEEGMSQILNAVKTIFNEIIIVPVGEFKPYDWDEYPTLVNYWNWPSMQSNRSKQVGLLNYIKTSYNVLGVIGMRSGVIDLFALLGFKTISIDRKGERGFKRPYKTQAALGKDFFRVVEMEYPRENEKLNSLGDGTVHWKGTIHKKDLEKIISTAKGFFDT